VSATTLLGQYADWIAGKQVNLLADASQGRPLPRRPLITELAQGEEQRQIIRLIVAGQAIASFFGPPGIPADISRRCARRSTTCRTPSSGRGSAREDGRQSDAGS
jgi:hypothetical protein